MYELLVLSLLKKFPLHAYLIYKIANDTIGPWETISRGTLSTLLNKLEQTEHIEEANPEDVPFPSGRATKTYKLTTTGEKRFFEIMMNTTKNLGNYRKIFHIKALYLDELTPDDKLVLVTHYIHFCTTAISHIKEQLIEFDEMPVESSMDHHFLSSIKRIMKLELDHWESELAWIGEIKEQEIRKGS